MFHVSFNIKNDNWGMHPDPCDARDKALKNMVAALERKSCWEEGIGDPESGDPAQSEDDQLGDKGNQGLDEDGGQGVRGGVIDTTTSQKKRDNRGGGKGHGNCDGNKKCLAANVA